MVEYTKRWLSLDEQVDQLTNRGVNMGDRDLAVALLKATGYYRMTGYLYPFRQSEQFFDNDGRTCTRLLGDYKPGTALHHAESLIDFDRRLRMLVMEGVERIEVAVRMRIGYELGRTSAFAHEDPTQFTVAFTSASTDSRGPAASSHVQWLQRVHDRRTRSDEQFVAHFREKYDDHMPIWALTEILEMGHLCILYRGMQQSDAEAVAAAFGVPTKKSWSVGWRA